jgi:bacterial/archaeal transporter family-2 protein
MVVSGSARLLGTAAAVAVGGAVAVQARVNGTLAERLGGGFTGGTQAALANMLTGLTVATVIVLTVPVHRHAVARLRSDGLPPWQHLGGLGGAFLVTVQAASVPLLGVAVFTVCVVAGQTGSGLLVDRAGLGPGGVQPVTVRRVVAAAVALGAVVLAVSGRLGAAGVSLLPVAACVAAGAAVSVQSALNGLVGRATGTALAAAWLNFVVGTLVVVGLVAALLVGGHPLVAPPGSAWLYVGGPLGLLFVAVVAAVVPVIGVLLVTLATVAGQVVGALVLDAVAPSAGDQLTARTVLGAAFTVVAVVIGSSRGPAR